MPRTLTPWAIVIPFLGLSTFAATYYFFNFYANPGISGLTPTVTELSAYAETRIRVQWLAATVAFAFVVAVAIASLLIDVFSHRTLPDGTRRWRYDEKIRIGASAALALVIIVVLTIVYSDDDRLYLYLGETLFDAVFGICGEVQWCFGPGTALDGYDTLMRAGATMAIAGVAACAIGSVLSLAQDTDRPYTPAEVGHAKFYLYLSSALLSFGILGMMAWMRLPLAVLAGETETGVYTDFLKSVVLYWGVAYSVIILSYNLPTMVIMHLRGVRPEPLRPNSDTETANGGAPIHGAATGLTGLRDVVAAALAFLTPTILPLSVELGSNLLTAISGAG